MMRRLQIAVFGLVLTLLAVGVTLAQTATEGTPLNFSSTTEGMNTSIGPVTFPDGTYRAVAKTRGRLNVSMRSDSGTCGGQTLFDIAANTAADGTMAYVGMQSCTARIVVNGATAPWTLVFEPVDARAVPSLTAPPSATTTPSPTATASLTVGPSPTATRTLTPTSLPSAIPFAGSDVYYSGYDYGTNTTFGPLEIPAGRYYVVLSIDGPATLEIQPVSGSCDFGGPLFDFKPGENHDTAGVDFYSQGCTALVKISNATDPGWGLSFNPRFLDPTQDSLLTPTPITFQNDSYEFDGSDLPANPVLGPIEFPAGTYRVLVTTHGALRVDVRPISGRCDAGNLFDFEANDGGNQFTTEFHSEGCTASIAVSGMTTSLWLLDFYATFDPTPMAPADISSTFYHFDSDTEGLQGLIGPFDLPEGSYRISLTTDGYLSVSIDAVSGYCYGGLYSLSQDPVNETTEALIQSKLGGCKAILTINNTGADPWSLTITPIDPNATATSSKVQPALPTATDAQAAPRGRTAATALAPTPSAATADCDAAELKAWLLTEQNALDQSARLFRNSGRRDAADLVNDLLSQLSVVETQSRPSCADTAMIWTYSLYTTWIESAVCRAQSDSACSDNVAARAETAINQMSSLFKPLLGKSGLSDVDLTEISVDDFVTENAVTPVPTPTLTPTMTPTSPRKTAPHPETPAAPTPNAGRSGSGRNAQTRAIRSAIDSSLMVGRVTGVDVINADSIAELKGHVSGRGVIVAFSVSTLQQAAYPTDSILLMETAAAAINSNQFDLEFMIIVAFNPDSAAFSKASLVSVSDILDYQAGRITRDQLLKSIENIDNNTLPQV